MKSTAWFVIPLCVLLSALPLATAPKGSAKDVVVARLKKAIELTEQRRYVAAKTEIEAALSAVVPLAEAQIPEPEIVKGQYVNYACSFRVSTPGLGWKLRQLKMTGPVEDGGTILLCQAAYSGKGATGEEVAIFYARDLRAFLGPRFKTVRGNESTVLKTFGKQSCKSITDLKDVMVTGQTDLEIAGCPAVRTDYNCRKALTPMKCFNLQVLRGHMLFSATFISTKARFKDVKPGFDRVIDSIDLSTVPLPPGPVK